jgi:diguanylate cyclase
LSKSIDTDRKLKNEATVDFLTGLNNVRQFKKDFYNFAQQTIRKGENLSLLYLDIDYFKNVNDTYGHSSGDIVLRNLAIILRNTCRSFDIISRNGGEEFSVLLLDCSASHAFRIAERIRKNVDANKFYVTDKSIINVTISIGVTTYPDITNNINNMIKNADAALYEAKRTGRNKVCMYDPIK